MDVRLLCGQLQWRFPVSCSGRVVMCLRADLLSFSLRGCGSFRVDSGLASWEALCYLGLVRSSQFAWLLCSLLMLFPGLQLCPAGSGHITKGVKRAPGACDTLAPYVKKL